MNNRMSLSLYSCLMADVIRWIFLAGKRNIPYKSDTIHVRGIDSERRKNTTRKYINCRKKMKNEDKWRMNKMGLLKSQWMLQYSCFTDKINIYALSNVGGCYYDAVAIATIAIAITASNNAAFILLLLPAPGCYATRSKMKETKWNKRILQKYFIVEWKWKLSILEFSFEEKFCKAHKSGDRIDKAVYRNE